jgi:hypothetical protein
MAVDNQLLLATVLAVGLGYFALTRKPQSASSGEIRREIQQQNIDLQMDQVDEIFKEFKIDWSKRGNNANTTPITQDELALLTGLEKNIRRIDKEVGRSKPFDTRDLESFAARRDDLYENIGKYKSKFIKSVRQNLVDSRDVTMNLGDIVEAGAHKDLFNSAVPRRYDPSRKEQFKSLSRSRAASLSRTAGAYQLGPFAEVTVQGANPGTASQVLADSHSRSVSLGHEWRRSTSRLQRGFTRSRSKRSARGVSTGQQPFNNAPKAGKRVNKEKPSDGMVEKDNRGGFEAVAPQNNNNSQEDARNTNQENAERGSDRAKETPTYVAPVRPENTSGTTASASNTPFVSVEGLADDNVDMKAAREAKPVKAEPKKKMDTSALDLPAQTQPEMNSAPDPKAPTEEQAKLKRITDYVAQLDFAWASMTSMETLNDRLAKTQAMMHGVHDFQGRLHKLILLSYKQAASRIEKSKKTRAIAKVIIPSVQKGLQPPKRARTLYKKEKPKATPPPMPEHMRRSVPPPLRRAPSSLVGVGSQRARSRSGPNMNTAPKPPGK